MIRELIIKSDYALVPLTQGKFAIIDLDDVDKVRNYNWIVIKNRNVFYAITNIHKKLISMHRFILYSPKNFIIDHIDGNGLNNKKNNLRLCTNKENIRNQRKQNRKLTSVYKGVYLDKYNKWICRIKYNGNLIYGGYFENEKLAAIRYNELALKYHGKFAKLNDV